MAQTSFEPIQLTVKEYRIVGDNPLGKSAQLVLAPYLGDLLGLEALASAADALEQAGMEVGRVNKVLEGRPHIVDMIKNDEADMIINTTEGRRAIEDSASIRASAEAHRVFYTTTLTAAEAICMAMKLESSATVCRLQDLHGRIGV